MSQYLPYKDNEYKRNVELEDFSKTPGDWDNGYFVEIQVKNSDKIEKIKVFPLRSMNKKENVKDYREYMNSIKRKNYLPHDHLIFDWSDKQNY